MTNESKSNLLELPHTEKTNSLHSTNTTTNSKINKTKKSIRNKLRLWIINIEKFRIGFVIKFMAATAKKTLLSLNPNAMTTTHSMRIVKDNAIMKSTKTPSTKVIHNLS